MTLTLKDVVEFLKRYLIGTICAVLSLIVLFVCYLRSSRASELNTRLSEVEAHAQGILGDVENSANLGEQFAALAKATTEMDTRLLRSSDRARNQQYFYEIESETGVKEVGLQPASGDSRKDSARYCYGLGYSITVVGDFRQILNFVGCLESGRHFYRFTSASVTRQRTGSSSGGNSPISLALNLELLGLP